MILDESDLPFSQELIFFKSTKATNKFYSRISGLLKVERVIGFTGSYVGKSIAAFTNFPGANFQVLNLELLAKARGENKII